MKVAEAWTTLGLVPGKASEEDVQKAFKALAKEHHPDKGGNETLFKAVLLAKNILLGIDAAEDDLDLSTLEPESPPPPRPPPGPRPTWGGRRSTGFGYDWRRQVRPEPSRPPPPTPPPPLMFGSFVVKNGEMLDIVHLTLDHVHVLPDLIHSCQAGTIVDRNTGGASIYVWFREDAMLRGGEWVSAHIRYRGTDWAVQAHVQGRGVHRGNRLVWIQARVDQVHPLPPVS